MSARAHKTTSSRVACCVPFCKRTQRFVFEADEEWLCNRHYNGASHRAIAEYSEAWRQAVKADKRAEDGFDPPISVYQRVTAAWQVVLSEALEAALGANRPPEPASAGKAEV